MKREVFKFKKVNFEKLTELGFKKSKDFYIYSVALKTGEFIFEVRISQDGELYTEVFDPVSKTEYTLHHIAGADGEFVGRLREEYEKILSEICEKCFEDCVFKGKYTYELFQYAQDKYGDNPEYLWEKTPNNAILRRKDTQKWYAVVMTINKKKLGFEEDAEIEVVNLHALQDDVSNLLSKNNIYPAYHMNKKHWITIILDSSMEMKEIYKLLDESYCLAKK